MKNKLFNIMILTLILITSTITFPENISGEYNQKNTETSSNFSEGILQGVIELTYNTDDVPDTIRPEREI